MEKISREKIRIDDKLYFIYCPKCGVEKGSPKSSYCKSCAALYQNSRRSGKGGVERYLNRIQTAIENKRIKREGDLAVIEFVDRIEKRKCMASDYELFVELIGHYNFCISTIYSLDTFTSREQLLKMWDALCEYRGKLNY